MRRVEPRTRRGRVPVGSAAGGGGGSRGASAASRRAAICGARRRAARQVRRPCRRGRSPRGPSWRVRRRHRRLTRYGGWLAAVLAAGPGAVLSHRSAAALWGIRDFNRRTIEITAPREVQRPNLSVCDSDPAPRRDRDPRRHPGRRRARPHPPRPRRRSSTSPRLPAPPTSRGGSGSRARPPRRPGRALPRRPGTAEPEPLIEEHRSSRRHPAPPGRRFLTS